MKKTFKEFLTPSGYSEGPMSLVTHMGILYKLDRIIELSKDLPVTDLNTAELKWQVDKQIVPSVGQKAKDKGKVDVKVPIIVTPHNGVMMIIDGFHRAQKALKDKHATIPARIIFHDVLAMAKFGSDAGVTWASNVDDLNAYLGEATSDDVMKKLHSAFKDKGIKCTLGDVKSVFAGSKALTPGGHDLLAELEAHHGYDAGNGWTVNGPFFKKFGITKQEITGANKD